ncbi:MAG: response regulator transcription factor [Acidimicrobiia bacterium]|nr:response regulator transcription factor [Acidimicrobiia bacterium]
MTDIRVLLVDDQALVRTGFRMILDSEPGITVVGEAENGLEGIAQVKSTRPDVVLMDIRMPEMDGVQSTKAICALNDPPRVVVLTTFDLDEYIYDALAAGASGFLLKDVTPEDLIAGVKVIANGDALLAPSVTRTLLADFAAGRPGTFDEKRLDQLTARETDVLQLMAKGLSNAEIAAELFVGETTVKTHVSHILTKLDLRDRVQAVVVAYETGLITPGH